MHDTDTRGARRTPRPRLRWTLLLVFALLIPATVSQAQPVPNIRPLFRVASQQWRHATTTWKAYPAGSWTVQGGTLTNRQTGVKVCGPESGPGNCTWESLIAAPYHIPTTRYAVDVVMAVQGSHGEGNMGTILLFPDTSAGPVLWLTMGDNGLFGPCRTSLPMLVGNPPNDIGRCGFPLSATRGPRGFPPPMDSHWHHYRVEIRGKQYRFFLDRHLKEVVNAPRPAVGRGVVPGFYAIAPQRVPSLEVRNRIWVKSVTITALPASAQR